VTEDWQPGDTEVYAYEQAIKSLPREPGESLESWVARIAAKVKGTPERIPGEEG
jgi:hypothetical protein